MARPPPDGIIERLRAFLIRNPGNNFARYRLSSELARIARHEEALGLILEILSSDPEFVSAYREAAHLFEALGRLAEAQAILIQGIASASTIGRQALCVELERFLARLRALASAPLSECGPSAPGSQATGAPRDAG